MSFNSTNVHIKVNGNWLNDAVALSWQQQGGVEPLYGYYDQEFRTTARRSNIITGTLGIYYEELDKFFRYLQTSDRAVERQNLEQEQERIRSEVDAATANGELLTLLTTLDMTSSSFDKYKAELEKKFKVQRPVENPFERATITNADVLGRSGYDLLSDSNGARIDIHYGDDPEYDVETLDLAGLSADVPRNRRGTRNTVETLYGVWLIGRARSPIENSPGNSAEGIMEYYSFIARQVGRPV